MQILEYLIFKYVPEYKIDARLLAVYVLLVLTAAGYIRWERRRG